MCPSKAITCKDDVRTPANFKIYGSRNECALTLGRLTNNDIEVSPKFPLVNIVANNERKYNYLLL
jgi:hypothetical protein